MTTYVRLTDDKNVYAVDGFLEFTFNKDANSFRNNSVISSDYKNWSKLTFTYPGDSSFTLTQNNGKWLVNNQPVDSAKTAAYLNHIAHLTSAGFYENNDFGDPNIKLRIETNNKELIDVNAIRDADKYILSSSQNAAELFEGNKGNLGSSLYKGPEYFLTSKTVANSKTSKK